MIRIVCTFVMFVLPIFGDDHSPSINDNAHSTRREIGRNVSMQNFSSASNPVYALECDSIGVLFNSPVSSTLRSYNETKRFYSQRCDFTPTPVWSDSSGQLNLMGQELLESIRNISSVGLNPERYHLNRILTLLNLAHPEPSSVFAIEQDTLFTDAYLTLAKDLYYGVTDWNKLVSLAQEHFGKFEWDRPAKKKFDPNDYLNEHLIPNRIAESLQRLSPHYSEYDRLILSLKFYREIQSSGGWPTIPEGKTLRPNDIDPRIPLLRKRLLATADIRQSSDTSLNRFFDSDLIDAVKSFQTRHNLLNDGIVGKKTLQALNRSVEDHIRTIMLNLERYRWMPEIDESSASYIDVNIPSFELAIKDSGYSLMKMKIIVGKPGRPTPVLIGKLSYAVLNPSWTAPETIVKEDIVGKKDVMEYLESHNMRVFAKNKQGRRIEIDPFSIDWSAYADAKQIPFTFVADAGEDNPLGGIKFIFPNRYSVYLHDTNAPALFSSSNRALSSGCIRLSKPQALLDYLIPENGITLHSDETVNEKSDKILNLNVKPTVVFRYMTASMDEQMRPLFYDDIYGYDTVLNSVISADIADTSLTKE